MGFKTYIRPFNEGGDYADWQEVTSDVLGKLGAINADLDNTEYDIGVSRFNNLTLKLDNENGKFSDVGEPNSIFAFTRSNSLVRVDFIADSSNEVPMFGASKAGRTKASVPYTVFTGLLNDEAAKLTLSDQAISFTVLGRESIFKNAIVPFGSVHNGDTFSQVLFALLNQPAITTLLRVDALEITPGIDLAIDSIAGLQNKTVQEGLNQILLVSNSVLYIEEDTVVISPRAPSADLKYTFYGQGSLIGPESIKDIQEIKNGHSRIFNYLTWKDTTVYVQDAESVVKYGIHKKEIEYDGITDGTKQTQILTALLEEFKLPKQEFSLHTPLLTSVLKVGLLHKVNMDYPTIYLPSENELPICGLAVCGNAWLPTAQFGFTLEPTAYYKVLGRSIDEGNDLVKFRVRAI